MQFHIVHTIRYQYSRAVFLEPHEVRLQPRNCGYQRLREFDLQVTPAPAGVSQCLDTEGNSVANLWFEGEYRELSITARSQVDTLRVNPFDYLLRGGGLPLVYDASSADSLRLTRQRNAPTGEQDEVARFADHIRQEAGDQLMPFLDRLNQTIYADFQSIYREQGEPWPAAETLSKAWPLNNFPVFYNRRGLAV